MVMFLNSLSSQLAQAASYFGTAEYYQINLLDYYHKTAGVPFVYAAVPTRGWLFPPVLPKRWHCQLSPVRFGGPGEPSQEVAEWLVSNEFVA